MISLKFPAQSCWDRILELLFEPVVSQAEKAAVCRRLVQSTAGVPDYVREELAARLSDLRVGESDMLGGPSGLQAVVDRVALSLGLLGEFEAAGMLAAGVTSPDHAVRAQTAAMLGDTSVAPAEGVGALVGLANDASFAVRRSVAAATAARVRSGDTSPLLFSLLAHFLSDAGRTLPLVAVHSLAGEASLGIEVRPLVEPLLVHCSAHVRQTAERVLAQS